MGDEEVTGKPMDFECQSCGRMFSQVWFSVARSFERVHFDGPMQMPEIEVAEAEGLAEFCSSFCLAFGKQAVMDGQGVPIPATRPGIGPIESCAKCSGPVDTSGWHLTFAEEKLEDRLVGLAVLGHDYIAVVCKRCSPRDGEKHEALETGAEVKPAALVQ